MGFWATGVSVVTAEAADGPAGATANAFTSRPLTPPLALVCFDTSSRTLHAVRQSERFCVNGGRVAPLRDQAQPGGEVRSDRVPARARRR
jgi:hypothetical protein